MRTRSFLGISLAVVGALLSAGAPAQAAEPKVFESTIAVPAHDGAKTLADEMVCPGPGDADGSVYRWIDLGGEFKHFRASGPAHLFNEPDPTGLYHDANDYDIDLYTYDAKCREVTPSTANGPAGTEVYETRRPARFALIAYWSGIHPNLPVKLEVANSKIK